MSGPYSAWADQLRAQEQAVATGRLPVLQEDIRRLPEAGPQPYRRLVLCPSDLRMASQPAPSSVSAEYVPSVRATVGMVLVILAIGLLGGRL